MAKCVSEGYLMPNSLDGYYKSMKQLIVTIVTLLTSSSYENLLVVVDTWMCLSTPSTSQYVKHLSYLSAKSSSQRVSSLDVLPEPGV